MSDKMRPIVEQLPEGFSIELTIFEDFIHPKGHLDWAMESHALMFYYLNARRTYEIYEIGDPIVYEGKDDPRCNYHQSFESIASLYGVDPNKMNNHWPMIDAQCDLMGLPRLPEETKYRYSSIIQLN